MEEEEKNWRLMCMSRKFGFVLRNVDVQNSGDDVRLCTWKKRKEKKRKCVCGRMKD